MYVDFILKIQKSKKSKNKKSKVSKKKEEPVVETSEL